MSPAGPSSWASTLDALESELHSARNTSPIDLVAPPVFTPPADLGPLPESLRARAEALLELLADTQLLIERSMNEIRRDASMAEQLASRGPRPASTVDLTA